MSGRKDSKGVDVKLTGMVGDNCLTCAFFDRVRITLTLTKNKSKLALLHVFEFFIEILGNTTKSNATVLDSKHWSDHSNSLPNCQIDIAAKNFIINLNKYIDGVRGRHHANETFQLTNQKEKSEQDTASWIIKWKNAQVSKMVFVLLFGN